MGARRDRFSPPALPPLSKNGRSGLGHAVARGMVRTRAPGTGFLLGSCSPVRICPAWPQFSALWRKGLGWRGWPAGWSSACGSRQRMCQDSDWSGGACMGAGNLLSGGARMRVTCGGQLFSLRICQACACLLGLLMEGALEAGAGQLMVQHLWLTPQEWCGWPVSSMHGA